MSENFSSTWIALVISTGDVDIGTVTFVADVKNLFPVPNPIRQA